ncbi:MAG: DUF4192 domain-containing protein [Bifidobacteriaceae bacterium]|jgi:hypothetical protein|nr:DUF4192 domain-containing protein [Bifidobacteriaceae bacterium]
MSAPAYTVNKASGLDVVAILRSRIGYEPSDSLIVAGLHPPRGRLGIVIRVDRIALDLTDPADFARDQAARLAGSGAQAAFVVRYADQPAIQDDAAFWQWCRAINERLAVTGCWDVNSQACQQVDPAIERVFGPIYGPADLQATRGAAAAVLAGLAPRARREDLATIELAPAIARKAARTAERRATDRSLALSPAELKAWRLTGLEVWQSWHRRLIDRLDTAVPAAQLGRIAALLTDPVGRDSVMATVFLTPEDTPRRIVADQIPADVFDPWTSPGVDETKTRAGLALLEQVAAHLMPRRRGAVYALGAAWHWWNGNGAAADEWAKAGADCVSSPRLGGLIQALVARGIFPAALEKRNPF